MKKTFILVAFQLVVLFSLSFSQDASYHFKAGLQLLEEKSYQESIKKFKEAIAIDNSYSAAYSNMGICYEKLNKLDEAIWAWEKRLESDISPEWKAVAQERLELLKLKKSLEYSPMNTDIRIKLGKFLLKMGEYAESKTQFEEVLRQSPKDETAKQCIDEINENTERQWKYANFMEEQKMYDQAVDIYKKIVSQYPDGDLKTLARFHIGQSKFEQKKYYDAAVEFSLFAKNYPKHSLSGEAMYRSGSSYRIMGLYEKALEEYQKILENYKDDKSLTNKTIIDIGNIMSTYYMALGKFDELNTLCENMSKKFPNSSWNSFFYYYAAYGDIQRQRWVDASEKCVKGLSNPEKFVIKDKSVEYNLLLLLGFAYERLGDGNKAVDAFSRAVKDYPGGALIDRIKQETRLIIDNDDFNWEPLRRYVSAEILLGEDLFYREFVQVTQNVQMAIGEYTIISEKYGNSKIADKALFRKAYCYEKLKNVNEAAASYAAIIFLYPNSQLIGKAKYKLNELKGITETPESVAKLPKPSGEKREPAKSAEDKRPKEKTREEAGLIQAVATAKEEPKISGEPKKEEKQEIKVEPKTEPVSPAQKLAEDMKKNYESGMQLYSSKQYEEAVNRFQKVLSVDPDFHDARMTLAECYAIIGRYEESVREYGFVFAKDKGNAKAKEGLCDAYLNNGLKFFNKGQKEKAIKEWEKGLVIDPSNLGLKELIEKFR